MWPLVVRASSGRRPRRHRGRRPRRSRLLVASCAARGRRPTVLMVGLVGAASSNRVYLGTDTRAAAHPARRRARAAVAPARPTRPRRPRGRAAGWVGVAILAVAWIGLEGRSPWLYRGGFARVLGWRRRDHRLGHRGRHGRLARLSPGAPSLDRPRQLRPLPLALAGLRVAGRGPDRLVGPRRCSRSSCGDGRHHPPVLPVLEMPVRRGASRGPRRSSRPCRHGGGAARSWSPWPPRPIRGPQSTPPRRPRRHRAARPPRRASPPRAAHPRRQRCRQRRRRRAAVPGPRSASRPGARRSPGAASPGRTRRSATPRHRGRRVARALGTVDRWGARSAPGGPTRCSWSSAGPARPIGRRRRVATTLRPDLRRVVPRRGRRRPRRRSLAGGVGRVATAPVLPPAGPATATATPDRLPQPHLPRGRRGPARCRSSISPTTCARRGRAPERVGVALRPDGLHFEGAASVWTADLDAPRASGARRSPRPAERLTSRSTGGRRRPT